MEIQDCIYQGLDVRVALLSDFTLPEMVDALKGLKEYHEKNAVTDVVVILPEEKCSDVERYYKSNQVTLDTVGHLSLPLGYARKRELSLSCSPISSLPFLLQRIKQGRGEGLGRIYQISRQSDSGEIYKTLAQKECSTQR